MINELNAESKAVGLKMNQLKTKVMFNQNSNQQNITLDTAKLEPVNKFFLSWPNHNNDTRQRY